MDESYENHICNWNILLIRKSIPENAFYFDKLYATVTLQRTSHIITPILNKIFRTKFQHNFKQYIK